MPETMAPAASVATESGTSDTMKQSQGISGKSNNKTPPLLVKKISPNATIPSKGSEMSAGYDLYAAYEYEIPPQGKGCVMTDISVSLPFGVYGRVAPRSGLAVKKHIDIGAGVIDADYRGNVGVVMFNHAQTPFKVEKGDRVAQLILEHYMHTDIVEVPENEELPSTERGACGFGSTGGSEELKK